MEWLVKNAVNRDVERQHLNKILQEIKAANEKLSKELAAVRAAAASNGVQDAVGAMVVGNKEKGISVNYDAQNKKLDFVTKDFSIRLEGDVTGVGNVTSLGSVVIDTVVTGGAGAPNDGAFYWQYNGEWAAVPPSVEELQYVEGSGILVRSDSEDSNGYEVRTIEGTTDEIDVADGDGLTANPTVSLADLADSGDGVLLGIDRDSKGRVAGTKAVTAGAGITITDIGASIEIEATGGGGGGSAAYDLGDSSAITSGEFAMDLGGSS